MANEFDVTLDGDLKINFGATGTEEVLQNVGMILNSVIHSCPMDRGFAYNGDLLDKPIHLVPTLLTSRLISAIEKYEPRASVVQLSFSGDGLNGQLTPKVRVTLKDG